jgi:hypothetical protein
MRLSTLFAAACAAALAAPAFADDAHHAPKAGKPAATKPAPHGMDMGKMKVAMQRMQEQMKEIAAASDPEERRRLVDEHMKSMREAMPMMAGM